MTSQNIQVFVRCCPLRNGGQSTLEIEPDDGLISIVSNAGSDRNYQFDRVFGPTATQNEVYISVVRPLIEQVLQGYNCTVLAYGQTGTGKTYTIEGQRESELAEVSWDEESHNGLIPRAVGQLFESLSRSGNKFSVHVSFLQLYNEETYDLLSDDMTKLRIFDDVQKKGSVIIGGLEEKTVRSESEIYEILRQGSLKRQTAATNLNACSSRSHTIFNLRVNICEGDVVKVGKLNLVDLAGSENVARSGAQDERAREAGRINQSLLALSRVIKTLVENGAHVPYRESKLTRILQDSLGGSTKTSIIATISPSENDLTNTVSTLDYASRARCIVNKPESNQHFARQPSLSDLDQMRAKHAAQLAEQEIRVRNEVALEFKVECERMKQSYKQQFESLTESHRQEIKKLWQKNEQIMQEKEELLEEKEKYQRLKETYDENTEKLSQELEALEELKRRTETIHGKTIEDLQHQLQVERDQSAELEQMLKVERERVKVTNNYRDEDKRDFLSKLAQIMQEKRLLEEKVEELMDQLNTKRPGKKRATKTELEACNDYANITFGDDDEIVQVTDKKKRKKIVPGPRRRAINQAITLSGKKRKLKSGEDIDELSPIAQENVRVTRSRTTRRKLEF